MNDIITNETIKTVVDRRSIRSYKSSQISKKELDTILESALKSPSAMNRQPCYVRVLQDSAVLGEMNDDFLQVSGKDAGYIFHYNAPTFIVIFALKNYSYSPIDSGIMVENMSLAAESLGIGSCIIGCIGKLFRSDKGQKWYEKLKAPEHTEFTIGLTLGYKNENPEAKPRDDSRIVVL